MRPAHTQRWHEPKARTSPATALCFPQNATAIAEGRQRMSMEKKNEKQKSNKVFDDDCNIHACFSPVYDDIMTYTIVQEDLPRQ
jgi:hypothetical protein